MSQICQKDFLFDPLAAAYYERFSNFQPGNPLVFSELTWPALRHKDSPKHYKTFYQEYCSKYGIEGPLDGGGMKDIGKIKLKRVKLNDKKIAMYSELYTKMLDSQAESALKQVSEPESHLELSLEPYWQLYNSLTQPGYS